MDSFWSQICRSIGKIRDSTPPRFPQSFLSKTSTIQWGQAVQTKTTLLTFSNSNTSSSSRSQFSRHNNRYNSSRRMAGLAMGGMQLLCTRQTRLPRWAAKPCTYNTRFSECQSTFQIVSWKLASILSLKLRFLSNRLINFSLTPSRDR